MSGDVKPEEVGSLGELAASDVAATPVQAVFRRCGDVDAGSWLGRRIFLLPAFLLPALLLLGCGDRLDQEPMDLVILEGRVVDPESGLDGIRNVGIRDGRIAAVTEAGMEGRDTIDATGLVVAPGFVDLHGHGQDDENYRVRVRDGVTTALELELGTANVDAFYGEREGRALIHHGASAGHVPIRIRTMGDAGTRLPVGPAADRPGSEDEVREIVERVREGLRQGAPAVGFSIQNTPAATPSEVEGIFRVAAEFGVPVHVHLRHMGPHGEENSLAALEEVLAYSRRTGARLHVAHIHSSGLGQTGDLLDRISQARAEGVEVTTEVYPYTAGQTNIEGAMFREDWRRRLDVDYGDLEWPATGGRLTEATFRRYRSEGGLVIIHMIPPASLGAAIAHPHVAIASDGLIAGGRGHPRAAGSYSRVLGRYVREEGLIELAEAIRKMSLLPATVLEHAVPAMARKGRVQPGADADLVLFDPETVIDRATYEEPILPPVGIPHVLVAGVSVVRHGELDGSVAPGKGIRRTLEP